MGLFSKTRGQQIERKLRKIKRQLAKENRFSELSELVSEVGKFSIEVNKKLIIVRKYVHHKGLWDEKKSKSSHTRALQLVNEVRTIEKDYGDLGKLSRDIHEVEKELKNKLHPKKMKLHK